MSRMNSDRAARPLFVTPGKDLKARGHQTGGALGLVEARVLVLGA
jgi:hypothetical protein